MKRKLNKLYNELTDIKNRLSKSDFYKDKKNYNPIMSDLVDILYYLEMDITKLKNAN